MAAFGGRIYRVARNKAGLRLSSEQQIFREDR
jgi:hypothetical protein